MLWSKELLQVNPRAQVAVHTVGEGKHRVVTPDGFYQNPDKVGELALGLYYSDVLTLTGNYPGARALVTLETGPLVAALSELWGS